MKRTTKIRRTWFAGAGLMVVGLVVVASWRSWPRERLLTAVARPVLKVDPMKTQLCWVSVHRLLRVTTSQTVSLRDSADSPLTRKDWKGAADILDTNTHVTKRLTGLTHLLNRVPQDPMHDPERFECSPDGTWILWETNSGGDGWPWPHAAYLDGTHSRDWYCNGLEEKFFQDTHHLVQVSGRAGMFVLDMQEPKRDRQLTHTQEEQSVLARYAVQQPLFVRVPDADEVAHRGFAEIAVYRMQDRLQRIESEYSETIKAPQPVQTWRLKLAPDATYQTGAVSSQQKLLFYDVVTSRLPSLLTWLHRLFPKFDPRPIVTEDLWVVGADGRGGHEIGSVPIDTDAKSASAPTLQDIRWLPDGKQISFIYRDTLYVVSAEPQP